MDQQREEREVASLTFQVAEGPNEDTGRGVARIDPEYFDPLGMQVGDILGIRGARETYARVLRTYTSDRGRRLIQLDETGRSNCHVSLGDTVEVHRAKASEAESVSFETLDPSSPGSQGNTTAVHKAMQNRVVAVGDRVRLQLDSLPTLSLLVHSTSPSSPVIIAEKTRVSLERHALDQATLRVSYQDIGGLGPQLQQVREVVELPLKYPEVFTHLGIEAPKGVLLFGPPGTGKTLLARAVAHETSAHFTYISGPEIFHKYYGESEAHLREVFREAREKAPSIIFLDEIDAIAAKREDVYGEVEKRVVGQLMALLDGLESRGQVIVIAATNIPDNLDPALRRPGRFDREIHIPIPDEAGRREVLRIHTRSMPLAEDVDLNEVARLTYGFVGADLAALCREAAMLTLRQAMEGWQDHQDLSIPEKAATLQVERPSFLEALKSVRPSVIREERDEGASVRWSQVAGLASAKKVLEESVLWPLKYPVLFHHANVTPAKGILLYGPPGSGKTLLARALATEAGVNFITVAGPSLLSKWVGESERKVRDIFKKARLSTPCILYFDEMEAVAPARGSDSDSGVTERVVSQLLAELDSIQTLPGVVVLGTTNRLDLVDPSLLRPGRFDLMVELPIPPREERLEIFRIHTQGKPLAPDLDLEVLADLTEGMTGGDIAFICRRALLLAIRQYIETAGDLSNLSLFTAGPSHFRQAMDEARERAKAHLAHLLARSGATSPQAQPPTPTPSTPQPEATQPLPAPRAPRKRAKGRKR